MMFLKYTLQVSNNYIWPKLKKFWYPKLKTIWYQPISTLIVISRNTFVFFLLSLYKTLTVFKAKIALLLFHFFFFYFKTFVQVFEFFTQLIFLRWFQNVILFLVSSLIGLSYLFIFFIYIKILIHICLPIPNYLLNQTISCNSLNFLLYCVEFIYTLFVSASKGIPYLSRVIAQIILRNFFISYQKKFLVLKLRISCDLLRIFLSIKICF